MRERVFMNHTRKRGGILAVIVVAALLFVASGLVPRAMAQSATSSSSSASAPTLEINKPSDLVGKKIAVLSGTIFDEFIMRQIPGIQESDLLRFNTNAEAVGALATGKADAFVTDSPIAELAARKNEGIGVVPEQIVKDQYGFVLPKGSPHTQELNERLEAYKKDGTLNRLREKWTSADDAAKTMPPRGWPAPKGTLVVATSTDNEPVNYSLNNGCIGLCIEILEMAAKDLGYEIEYRYTNSGSIIPEIQSGKADIGAYSFSITDERKQMVDMTDSFYDGGVAIVARIQGFEGSKNQGFFEGLAKSFERTFITESRWQLILEGLGVTLLISACSGALGLAIGFVFVLLRRKKEGGIADKLIRGLESLMGGLPVVVVLMVLYYVFFGGIDIPGIIVAIVGFTLIFAATSGSIMWNAVRAVDAGQTEAGRALGFGDRDTFFLVVLPQAARQFAPLLVAQFVSLVKDTSVVGFIAVQDLTRVGDIIRSRTMEAFFPLIAIAIIYFALCRLLAFLLNKFVVRKLEPKEGPRAIKGVKL